MKPPPGNENEVLDKLIESVRSHGDGKSIFGLLLLIERELRAESLDSRPPMTLSKDKQAPDRRPVRILRSYIE
jgi:hypothetical protein